MIQANGKNEKKERSFIAEIGESDISGRFGYLKTFRQNCFSLTMSLKWSIGSKSFDSISEEESLRLLKYITAALLHFGNYFWDYFKPFFIVKLSASEIRLDNVGNFHAGNYLKLI